MNNELFESVPAAPTTSTPERKKLDLVDKALPIVFSQVLVPATTSQAVPRI
jgi:hypothetical protein